MLSYCYQCRRLCQPADRPCYCLHCSCWEACLRTCPPSRLLHFDLPRSYGLAVATPLLCSFCSEDEDPLLWASTYQAGPALQALQAAAGGGGAGGPGAAVAAAAAQRLLARYCPGGGPGHGPATPAGDPRKAAVRGYKVQSARVLEHVDRLLTGCEARRQSVVVEGVHLSLRWVWAPVLLPVLP